MLLDLILPQHYPSRIALENPLNSASNTPRPDASCRTFKITARINLKKRRALDLSAPHPMTGYAVSGIISRPVTRPLWPRRNRARVTPEILASVSGCCSCFTAATPIPRTAASSTPVFTSTDANQISPHGGKLSTRFSPAGILNTAWRIETVSALANARNLTVARRLPVIPDNGMIGLKHFLERDSLRFPYKAAMASISASTSASVPSTVFS